MNAHIWRYLQNQRNYPGYNLSADAAGCEALLAWLSRTKDRTEFRLQPVTPEVLSVPNNGTATTVSYSSLKIEVKPKAAFGLFQFSEVAGKLTLECCQDQVECIIKGVEDIAVGHGDYCIGGSGQNILWFWWYPPQHTTRKSVPI